MASANHPSGMSAEQHWELLGHTVDNLTADGFTEIGRGVLPGGTTKFGPAPSATFEVVARHASGQSGSAWLLKLESTFGVLATVSFSNGDSSYSIKTASVSWS